MKRLFTPREKCQRSPVKPIIAIVGRPNVGKSTLFNRLIGSRRAITLDTAGVPRDRHYGRVSWDGRDFILVDTGGLVLEGAGSIEKKIKEQVDLAIREAAIILYVMDGRAGLQPAEQDIAKYLKRSPSQVLYLVNKVDTTKHESLTADFYTLGVDLSAVSAEHGLGVNDLLDQIVKILPETPEPSEEESQREAKRIRFAIIGKPNVGKSSLLNRLLDQDRAITHEEAGTTRDSVDVRVRVGTKDFLLIDTAGIRRGGKSASKVERYSVLTALKSIERSDVCLLLLDATEEIRNQDAHIAGYLVESQKGVVIAWNKWDLVKDSPKVRQEKMEETRDGLKFLTHSPVLFISAKTGGGCSKIWKAVEEIHAASGKRVSTSKVNEVFEKLIQSHNPPVYRGKPVKFFYATQSRSRPPTFVIFVSDPEGVHFSFKRYLTNGFRKVLDFEGAPIVLIFRKKRS